MASVTLKNINKTYDGSVEAVKNLSLEIEDKDFVVLVGPSGCGKSTTLRMIAGLEGISAGELLIEGNVVNDVPSKDRNIAMVFQNYALYPHMSVYKNMSFALELAGVKKEEINRKVKETAGILKIENLLDRKPKQLSGGQRQRVALGRAIVRNPKVFLMDEPLSNLDAKLRVQMRHEITKLHKRLDTTFIYVTHDQTEAMTMGSKIVIMKDGILQQAGSPREVYENPKNLFVASFIGSPQMNFIEVKIRTNSSGVDELVYGENAIYLDEEKMEKIKRNIGSVKTLIVGIRTEGLSWETEKNCIGLGMGRNTITGTVDTIEYLGAEKHVFLDAGDSSITFSVKNEADIYIGEKIRLTFDENRLYFFDKEKGLRI